MSSTSPISEREASSRKAGGPVESPTDGMYLLAYSYLSNKQGGLNKRGGWEIHPTWIERIFFKISYMKISFGMDFLFENDKWMHPFITEVRVHLFAKLMAQAC